MFFPTHGKFMPSVEVAGFFGKFIVKTKTRGSSAGGRNDTDGDLPEINIFNLPGLGQIYIYSYRIYEYVEIFQGDHFSRF